MTVRHPAPRRRGHPDEEGRAAARRLAARLAALSPPPAALSPREAELLPWLATDLGYAAIADELGCGPHNARLLAARLRRRLGVATRPAAVARWLRPEGFIPPPGI
jgi:DNA-binding CsgD family transcriptional regulator